MTISQKIFLILILSILLWSSTSIAMELSLLIDQPGSCITIDQPQGVLHRSDNQEPMNINIADEGSTAQNYVYFIPDNSSNPGDFVLKFRLDNIPLERQHSTEPNVKDFYIGGPGGGYPEITDFQFGTGEGDFVEFSKTISSIYLNWDISRYFTISGEPFTFSLGWSSNVSITFVDPYGFDDCDPPNAGGSLNDHWFRLTHKSFPDSYTDGGPIPEYLSLESRPIAGATVSISGQDVIYDPDEATTDSNGIFGVIAFVDPDSFTVDQNQAQTQTFARTTSEKEVASKDGQLSLSYKQLRRSRKIKGYYCEVIMVEGKVTIVEGSGGNVKVGDILYPGTKLSLSSSWGTNAQIGLRFINGSNCQLVQDVYTNACITDLIVIGKTNFSNSSVIQGKTALMSATRYLCEEIAGLPNTPGEWAKAAGKLTVKTAASLAVPGSGVAAYAIRYGVKTATGKVYDHFMSSPGNNKPMHESVPDLNVRLSKTTAGEGDERVELSTYYDGSMRISENIPGAISMYSLDGTTPFYSTLDGQWVEFTDEGVSGRTFYQTPDTIDKEGPELRMAFEYFPDSWITRFELKASDTCGLDLTSLSVVMGDTDLTSSFQQQSPGVWTADLIGTDPSYYQLTVTLLDKVGNLSTMNWSIADVPAIPRNLTGEAAYFYGGKNNNQLGRTFGHDPDRYFDV